MISLSGLRSRSVFLLGLMSGRTSPSPRSPAQYPGGVCMCGGGGVCPRRSVLCRAFQGIESLLKSSTVLQRASLQRRHPILSTEIVFPLALLQEVFVTGATSREGAESLLACSRVVSVASSVFTCSWLPLVSTVSLITSSTRCPCFFFVSSLSMSISSRTWLPPVFFLGPTLPLSNYSSSCLPSRPTRAFHDANPDLVAEIRRCHFPRVWAPLLAPSVVAAPSLRRESGPFITGHGKADGHALRPVY